ncbi:hypothetical protein JOB18_031211 [Solea senegalensis]|uniref:Uncharacterized protein n=1 Tax=Solea senegalensis TaxID=28829 RepID=A0AAV6T8E3_SOLSE|nr:hypothetical protein JOB18_031211 [Solea senegalensis]
MQLHCRRTVRESREMEAMLKELIEAYDGERGCNTLGTLASDTFFQAYLVDGLARWNEDRTMTAEGTAGPHSYSGLLRHAANQLSEEVLGRKLVEYKAPRKYTGELIGIEYLYSQNNIAMEDYKLALATLETEDITVAEGDSLLEQFDVEDPTVTTLDTIWPPQQPTPSAPASNAPPAAVIAVAVTATPPAPTATATALPRAPLSGPSASFTVATMQSAAVTVCPPVCEDSGRPAGSNPSLGPQLQTDTPQTSQDAEMLCTHQAPQQDAPSVAEEQPSTSSCSTSHDDSVGPDNIEGFQAVQDLTGQLFTLKDHSLALSREEAECLSEYDKKKQPTLHTIKTQSPKGDSGPQKKMLHLVWRAQSDALQEGKAQRSGLTAIVCVRHFLFNFARSIVDPGALMESGKSVGALSPKHIFTSAKSF